MGAAAPLENQQAFGHCSIGVTGQLADTPTRGLPTRGLDKSRTGQLADAIGDFPSLVFLFGGICETAS